MCRQPLHIVNPSTWIDPNKGQSLFIDVPCGKCSECIVSYRNDWRNRAYYESLYTFTKSDDAYILFDTLTYRNGNLPHLSDYIDVPKKLDFPVFSNWHLSKFLDLLRTRLRRLGFDVKDGVRYFVACEYGDDIRFTRRPHYHILFFVSCDIPVRLLSAEIASCWIYGRTDGIPYRTASYVENNNVFRSLSDSERFSVNYVTKYCTKQFSYNKLVENRLNALLIENFDLYNSAKDYVQPFHHQSKSFGIKGMLELVGKDKMLETGQIKVIDKSGYVRFVNLSKSIQRKLLYDYYRDENGCVHWKLNADGFVYKKKFYKRGLQFLFNRVAGANYFDYSGVKEEVFNMFFVNNRFRKYDSVDELIDDSYNVETGLRNYSAVDYSFLRKRVFTGADFGSRKLGFKNVVLKQKGYSDFVGDCQFITLQDLEKQVFKLDNKKISGYIASRVLNGDGALEVMKLKHHLELIHKKNRMYETC